MAFCIIIIRSILIVRVKGQPSYICGNVFLGHLVREPDFNHHVYVQKMCSKADLDNVDEVVKKDTDTKIQDPSVWKIE